MSVTKFSLGTSRQYLSGDKVVLDDGSFFVCLVNAGYITSAEQPNHPKVNYGGIYWEEISAKEIQTSAEALAPNGTVNPAPILSPGTYQFVADKAIAAAAALGLPINESDVYVANEYVIYWLNQVLNCTAEQAANISVEKTINFKSAVLCPGVEVTVPATTQFKYLPEEDTWYTDIASNDVPDASKAMFKHVNQMMQMYQHIVHFRQYPSFCNTTVNLSRNLEILAGVVTKCWIDEINKASNLFDSFGYTTVVSSPMGFLGWQLQLSFQIDRKAGNPPTITKLS